MQTALPRRPYGFRRHLARAFGVRLVSDIPERCGDLGVRPWIDAKRRARLAAIRDAGVLFIHVPKNGGMSISHALYGMQIRHPSIRYYQCVAPDIVASMPSFAVIRDPIDRFLSAFAYAQAGGSRDNAVSLPFRADYAAFRSIDDAIDHVARARSPYHVDHIFRLQSWYVTDRDGGLAVDRLIAMDDLAEGLSGLPGIGGFGLPRINRSRGVKPALSAAQIARIRELYRADFALLATVAAKSRRVPGPFSDAQAA